MSLSFQQVQGLLLDMLADTCEPAALTGENWRTLLELARHHRLEPMLHWRLRHHHRQLAVPAPVAARLAQSHRASSLRSLALQRALLHVHRLLTAADIEPLALKGAFLAFHAYPQPGLRPMRDLDILVPAERALESFQLLQNAGFARLPRATGEAEEWMRRHRHLPPLQGSDGIIIEVHATLYDVIATTSLRDDQLSLPRIRARAIHRPLAGERIAYLSPTDLLLHLIVHAVYQHRFDNGPLVLNDLAYLLGSQPIDWPLFWQLADAGGYRPGCLLLLRLVATAHGDLALHWPSDGTVIMPPAQLLEASRLLTLRDFDLRLDVHFARVMHDQPSLAGKARLLWSRLLPPRRQILAGHAGTAGPRVLAAAYLRQWRRLLGRLPDYLGALRHPRMRGEVGRLAQLEKWLDGRVD